MQAALDKKAVDVVVLDLRKAGGFTDYFVICTGDQRGRSRDCRRRPDTLKKDFEERPALAEGVHKSEWILLDYFNFVVHVFSRECRAFYAWNGSGGTPSGTNLPSRPRSLLTVNPPARGRAAQPCQPGDEWAYKRLVAAARLVIARGGVGAAITY